MRDEIADRMKKTFDDIAICNRGKTVAIVGHGDPIGFLLYKLDHPRSPVLGMNKLVLHEYPKKGSATKIVWDSGKILEKVSV